MTNHQHETFDAGDRVHLRGHPETLATVESGTRSETGQVQIQWDTGTTVHRFPGELEHHDDGAPPAPPADVRREGAHVEPEPLPYRFLPHPDGERFDQVTVETVERWKESELSGDEWRFSHVATFWRHGRPVATVGGLTVEDALLRAAAEFGSVKVEGEPWLGDLTKVCCQPGCEAAWVVLMHPVRRYTRSGEQLARGYDEHEVRGFCARHRRRGDCGLDDADANYVLVLDRTAEVAL